MDFTKMTKEDIDKVLVKTFGTLPNFKIINKEKHKIDIKIK